MQLNNTISCPREVTNLLKPKDENEVIEIVKKHNFDQSNISFYSRGHNWGYGCNSPVENDSLVISLENLKHIKDFDEVNGIITLGPGVTYQALSQFLQTKGNKWLTPVHGGGPKCSVVGNILERGYGLTPITDHYQSIQCLRAVLKNGEIYEGGLSKLGFKRLDQLFKNGIGPQLDGAFTQSGLGIVTEITIKLAPKPEHVEMLLLGLKDKSQIKEVINIIKEYKRKYPGIVGGMNLMNKERMASMFIDYPEDKIAQGLMLTEEEIKKAAEENKTTDWNVMGAIYGDKEVVKLIKKKLKKSLRPIKKNLFFYNPTTRKILKTIHKFIPRIGHINLSEFLKNIDMAYDILQGIPSEIAVKLAYLKNEDKKQYFATGDLNPTTDNCGLIWYAPIVEINPSKVLEFVDFVVRACAKYNMNPFITLTTVDELCFDSTIPILFNKNHPEETQRAKELYNYLVVEGAKKGFFPYRLNIESQKHYKLDNSYILPNLIDKNRYS